MQAVIQLEQAVENMIASQILTALWKSRVQRGDIELVVSKTRWSVFCTLFPQDTNVNTIQNTDIRDY
jgi:hypothetical protein